ncbi:hypothetical protein O1611_g6879 [Lasiodiplodia mahajangana]|uniref:Uncharacterized protein n=1 Tax=Lasiodiplodia mahajangana TaxID=1108764 RepID=A0ACC2JHC0_9PEZI|nr:hypothetical protein O1611_g6879 [Lasiodiplodia mahajangana]
MSNPLNSVAAGASLLTLAGDVLKKTQDIIAYLRANDLPEPTFDVDSAPIPETAEYWALQNGLADALEDLQRLTEGPTKFLRLVSHWSSESVAFPDRARLRLLHHRGARAGDIGIRPGRPGRPGR